MTLKGICSQPRRRALAALAVSVAAVIGWAANAQPARALEVGVQDNAVFVFQRYYSRDAAFQRARQFNARTVRLELYWGEFIRYGYGFIDAAVDGARARGLRPQITIAPTPQSDPAGDQRISWRNTNVGRFAGWVKQIVTRYRGKVARYSLVNEPNMCYFLSRSSCSYSRSAVRQRAALYRRLYVAGYRAVKQADRRSQVLIGELAPLNDPLGFLWAATGPGVRADGFAHHPYELAGGRRRVVGISSTPQIRGAVRALGRSRKLRRPTGGTVPIYYTEFGYIRGRSGIRTERQRATRTVAAFRYIKRQGIRQVVYYHLVKTARGFSDPFASGILDPFGNATSVFNALVRARRSW